MLDLQGRAHDMPSGSGSPADDEAEHATTAEQLSRGMAVATAAVKQLIGAGKELTDVYEQVQWRAFAGCCTHTHPCIRNRTPGS